MNDGEWNTYTPKQKRKGKRVITPSPDKQVITPAGSSKPTASPFLQFTNTDSNKSLLERPLGKNRQPAKKRTEPDYDYWTMSAETGTDNKNKLGDLIDDNLDPIEEPTVIDLIHFKKKLGTALTKCKTIDRKKGGHIYLMYNDQKQFAERVGDNSINLPTAPTYPELRTVPKDGSNPISSTKYRIFERNEKLYNEHETFDRQAQDLLIAKFPKAVEGLRGADGDFDMSLTTEKVLTHLSETLDNSVIVNQCYMDVLMNMLTLTYKTNANGPVEWFNKAEKDRTMSHRLGVELGHEPIPCN